MRSCIRRRIKWKLPVFTVECILSKYIIKPFTVHPRARSKMCVLLWLLLSVCVRVDFFFCVCVCLFLYEMYCVHVLKSTCVFVYMRVYVCVCRCLSYPARESLPERDLPISVSLSLPQFLCFSPLPACLSNRW